MLSIEIIKRSFFATINNLDVAWKVSGFWWSIIVVLTLPYAVQSQVVDANTGSTEYVSFILTQSAVTIALYGIAFGASSIVGLSVLAIGWHRFLIKGWRPEKLLILEKEWPWGQYFWASFLLTLIALPLAIAPVIFIYVNPENYQQEFLGYSVIGLNFMVQLATLLPFTFFGLNLPSIALDQSKVAETKISFSKSWRITKPHRAEILMLVAVVALIYAVVIATCEQVFGSGEIREFTAMSVLGYIVGSFQTWAIAMFGVGLLSELYKALVQEKQMQEAHA